MELKISIENESLVVRFKDTFSFTNVEAKLPLIELEEALEKLRVKNDFK